MLRMDLEQILLQKLITPKNHARWWRHRGRRRIGRRRRFQSGKNGPRLRLHICPLHFHATVDLLLDLVIVIQDFASIEKIVIKLRALIPPLQLLFKLPHPLLELLIGDFICELATLGRYFGNLSFE